MKISKNKTDYCGVKVNGKKYIWNNNIIFFIHKTHRGWVGHDRWIPIPPLPSTFQYQENDFAVCLDVLMVRFQTC